MQRKAFTITMMLIAISMLAACGGKTTTAQSTAASTGSTAASSEVSVENRAPVTYKLSHGMIPKFSLGVASTAFAEKMSELSDGTVTIDVYDSASMGADVVTCEYVMMGDLDFAVVSSFALATTAGLDEVLLYDLPWHLNGDEDTMMAVVNGDPSYQYIFNDLLAEKNLKNLGFGHIGGYGFGGTSMVTTVEDIAGKKFRTAENAMIVDLFNSLNVQPVVINIGEVYTGIQQGICDGIYSTLTMMYMYNTYELADQVSEFDNAWCYAWLLANNDAFNDMDAELQGWLIESGAHWQETCLAQERIDRQIIIDDIAEKGGTYYALTDAERIAFKEACAPVTASWREKVGTELYDNSIAFIESLN